MTNPDPTLPLDPVEEVNALRKRIAELEAEKKAKEGWTTPTPTGMIDHDFVGQQAPPHYTWAGINLAGQQCHECSQCGALVRIDMQGLHTTFHGIVNGVAAYNGVQL